MSYLTDSYIVFTLKIESVSKNTIFGQKISMVVFITEFVILGTFMKWGKVVSRMKEFQKYFF